jgi:hypothetical protein
MMIPDSEKRLQKAMNGIKELLVRPPPLSLSFLPRQFTWKLTDAVRGSQEATKAELGESEEWVKASKALEAAEGVDVGAKVET